MRLTTLRRAAVPATLAVAVGLLSACGGSSGSGTSSTPKGDKTSASSEASPSESSSPADESSSPAAAGGDDCVIGSWVSDTEGLTRQMEKLMGDTLEGAKVSATGDIVTTFDGSKATAAYNAFTVTFNVTQNGMDMVMNLGFDGAATTTYTATGGQLTLGAMDMSGVKVSYTAKVGDQTMDLSDQLGDQMNGVGTSAGATSSFTCDATTLTTTTAAGGAEMTQVYKRK